MKREEPAEQILRNGTAASTQSLNLSLKNFRSGIYSKFNNPELMLLFKHHFEQQPSGLKSMAIVTLVGKKGTI